MPNRIDKPCPKCGRVGAFFPRTGRMAPHACIEVENDQ